MPNDIADARSTPVRLGDLGETIAYTLRLAQSASFQAFAELTGDSGLRPGRYALLQLIHDNPGLSQTDLSRAVGRDKTTLTPALAEMERTGMIVRTRHPTDGRSRMIRLTLEGEQKLAVLARCAARHNARLDEIVGTDSKAELVRLLRMLTVALERTPHETAADLED
ncbi:MAG TPA: MarR family transcriptional regulator [Stellaceae bacterium]|nr:MarR family transcriptional regulator [Stellaceae bacterium]